MLGALVLLMSLLPPTAPPGCAVTVFPRYGTYLATPRLHGPGLLLDGGGASEAPDASLAWLHQRLLGNTAHRAGNVVVLRAYGANVDDRHFYRAGDFASVQTVLIPPCATRGQVDAVAPIVDSADAVYFAGGDQAHYVAWKGTALIAAVKRVYARGGVVGGGSAGLAIQGAVVYDSVAGDRLNRETTTADAVREPFEPSISFTTGLFAWPALAGTITDTHLMVRNRIGRTIVFLARILHDGLLGNARVAYALGIDQGSAVAVGSDGTATVFNAPGGRGAYLIRADRPAHIAAEKPLRYTVGISHVARNGERFDLLRKRTKEPWIAVTVDGSRTQIYSRDPY